MRRNGRRRGRTRGGHTRIVSNLHVHNIIRCELLPLYEFRSRPAHKSRALGRLILSSYTLYTIAAAVPPVARDFSAFLVVCAMRTNDMKKVPNGFPPFHTAPRCIAVREHAYYEQYEFRGEREFRVVSTLTKLQTETVRACRRHCRAADDD